MTKCTSLQLQTIMPGCRQELAAAVVGEGLRPLAGAATPAPLQRLLDACWEGKRAARPTAQELVEALQRMLVGCCRRLLSRLSITASHHGNHHVTTWQPPPLLCVNAAVAVLQPPGQRCLILPVCDG